MSTAKKLSSHENLRQEILNSCHDTLFEVHQGPPPFWTSELDGKLEHYLAELPRTTFSTCPLCGHKLQGPECAKEFNDPWWIYPQRGFADAATCPHFENLTYSILWTHSEPIGAPWIIPCGWGVPALSESLSQNENLMVSIKQEPLPNGATIFWIGLYRQQPGIPIFSDFWALPILKTRNSIPPSPNARGFWAEFSPVTLNTSVTWSRLYIEQAEGALINCESQRDLNAWTQKVRHWDQLSYNQPLKMYRDRFVSESGLASFAIGMRSSRLKGALFISQTPIFAMNPTVRSANSPASKNESSQNYVQTISIENMKSFAQLEVLWALIDPFQNEAMQDWLRLMRRQHEKNIVALWSETEWNGSWQLSADSSHLSCINNPDLVDFYRDLSPVLVQITPDVLELSTRYLLGRQSWGALFLSSAPRDYLHGFLRHRLVCQFQNQWIYFRFYEKNFLSTALSLLKDSDLHYFYGPIEAWIFRNFSEDNYTLHARTKSPKRNQLTAGVTATHLPPAIHDMAQRVYQFELPRRIREFINERTPEFAALIPVNVLDRWIRVSIGQANHWGIKKEAHVIKFFLWKILITPTWCHLNPFVKILSQPQAEEVKIHSIELLFPQLRISEIPRGLTIESWDAELWVELRKLHSPLGTTDPSAFHTSLGEKPPGMPMQNPKWLKTIGYFYETAYGELAAQSGTDLLSKVFSREIQRPLYAPPRLLGLTEQEIIIKDEGGRSHSWLKSHGFEMMKYQTDSWILRSPNAKAHLLLLRQFLEAYPYVENRALFDFLEASDRKAVTEGLELFSVLWDTHGFWILNPFYL